MGGHFHSPSIARHQGIEAVSGPKLIADCFQPFSELSFGVIADGHANAHGLA